MNRRSFLRILGLGAIAGPTLLKAALKPATPLDPAVRALMKGEITHFPPTISFVRTEGLTLEKLMEAKRILSRNELEVPYTAYVREFTAAMHREKDRELLKAAGITGDTVKIRLPRNVDPFVGFYVPKA